MSRKCRFLYAACRTGEWLWVDSNGTYGKPTFRRLANLSWLSEICNHFGDIAASSPKSLTTVAQKLPFWKKSPYGQIFKNVFQKDSWRHRCLAMSVLHAYFAKFGWPEVGKVMIIYLTKKNKISARSPALASAWIAPKIRQGQLQTIYLECPKFHPNPFTSGRVIAECVNTVQKRYKVFPILGEAIAFSPSNDLCSLLVY